MGHGSQCFHCSVNLFQATRSFLELCELAVEQVPELSEERFLNDAVKRYECFWLPFRVSRTALLVPPVDVHVVWVAHMMSPAEYRADSLAAVDSIIDHQLMNNEDLRASRKVSRKMWARSYTNEPYNFEFSMQKLSEASDSGLLRSYEPLSQCRFMENISKIARIAKLDELKSHDEKLKSAIEKYKEFFLGFQENPRMEFESFPVEIEAVWSAHKMHPSMYATDCAKTFHGSLLDHKLRSVATCDRLRYSSLKSACQNELHFCASLSKLDQKHLCQYS